MDLNLKSPFFNVKLTGVSVFLAVIIGLLFFAASFSILTALIMWCFAMTPLALGFVQCMPFAILAVVLMPKDD